MSIYGDPLTLGGGGAKILTGTTAPEPSGGNDGGLYLRYEAPVVLPAGYTWVRYIAASGSQYIPTGVPARQQLKMEADFQYTGTAEATVLGGTGSATSVVYLGINPGNNYKSYYFRWASSWVNISWKTLTLRHKVSASMESGNIVITEDGEAVYTNSSTLSGTTAANDLTIFARNGSQYFFVGRLYRMRIWDWLDNGALIRDYIPAVRDSDDAVGLYELVQGQFCENAGSGTLTSGGPPVMNDVIGAYAKVNGAWQPLIGTSLDDIRL